MHPRCFTDGHNYYVFLVVVVTGMLHTSHGLLKHDPLSMVNKAAQHRCMILDATSRQEMYILNNLSNFRCIWGMSKYAMNTEPLGKSNVAISFHVYIYDR